MWRLLLLALLAAADDTVDKDGESSRKILGSSVVTSVSVIMDAGNGSKIYADAVGRPVSKPQAAGDVASPIDLLNPDRYEFYTFDDTGDLVKRLMTLEEIHDIIATGDDEGLTLDAFTGNGFIPEKRVNDVVNNVQNVLKEEIKMHKNPDKNQFDTPDVSDSWSMILPAVFGNSGEDIKPEAPIIHVTPDTIMVEPEINVMATTEQISTTEKVMTLQTKKTTPRSTTTTTERTPMINVEIITNSNSTTEKTNNEGEEEGQVVEIKPHNDDDLTKESVAPLQVSKTTKRPYPVKVTTFRPTKKPIISSTSTTPRSISTTTTKPSTTPSSTTTSTTTTTRPTTTSTTPRPTTTTSTTPRSVPTTTTTTTTSTTPITSTTTRATSTTTQITTLKSNQVIEDTLGQSSTVIFEKVAPPQPSTTTEQITTSQAPPIPEIVTSTPTTTSTETPTTTTEIPSTTTLPESTTTEIFTTTEEPKLTSFVTLSKIVPVTTTTTPTTSTFAPLSTFFVVSDNKQNESPQNDITDDLNTLSTEYVTSSKLPTNFSTTTESQSTDKASTALDQLLLTSTNIYEINSELSEVRVTTDNVDESTTSTEDKTTEKFLIRVTNPTEAPMTTTTDQTFIEAIEQLMSQAVGTPAPPIESEKEAMLVQDMMMNSGNKTMPEVMSEAATIASKLVGIGEESTTVPPTTFDDLGLLSDSVGSLLSQVYGQGSTTMEYDTPSTTMESTTEAITTTTPGTTTTTTEAFVPHIINITIIRNENRTQPKPAKSDLSLEKEYENLYNEMKKNSSLGSMVQNDEVLKTEATSFNQKEDTTEMMVDTTTEQITTTELPSSTTTSSTTKSSTTVDLKPSIVITINENKTEPDNTKWMLVSTLAPHSDVQVQPTEEAPSHQIASIVDPPSPVDLVPKPLQGFGLEDSTAKLDTDIYQFVQLCNELAFGFWKSVTTGISAARSVIVSPFAATSLLAMVFLGARGATSGEMNEILKLDDMVTFNPHLIFKNVSESIEANPDSGVAISSIIRELFSDRSKGKLLGFYKERVRQFYDGHVEEASFKEIGDIIRRRTNLLVKKNTDGKIMEFLKESTIIPKPPLAGVSVSIFETDCSQGSSEGRDGELHFVVLPSLRQRRLIPIPATVYRSGFLAGYEPSLDATAAALGTKDQVVSTIFIIPGQQGSSAPGDGLARLEKRLVESSFKKGAWSRLLRSLIPRPGLELQLPRFQHRSLINATQSLKRMGLHELFDAHKADLKGLNGAAHELHLSEVLQVNEFATCGERRIGEAHHREVYPATVERRSRLLLEEWEEPRDYQRAFHDPLHDPSLLELPLALRPRQARLPEAPRLRFDRPFLYFVRHNPSGLILHMGRFHPRLLP